MFRLHAQQSHQPPQPQQFSCELSGELSAPLSTRAIEFARQRLQNPERLRSIEIIIERGLEARAVFAARARAGELHAP